MEILSELNLKKRLIMRGYQETIVSDIIDHFGINTPYVLGACPSSGKTEMAIETMIRLIESGLVNRVLVLAHSTNVLKENFYNRLIEYFNENEISIMRGQKDYDYDAIIQVMIPKNKRHVIGQFDLVITDEAQHNVLAEMGDYSSIIEKVNPKFQLLLTGTPSKFVRENNYVNEGEEQPYHINCIGMDMIGLEHFHDVKFDLIRSAYGFTNDDYNRTQDLSEDVKFSFVETEHTINNVIIGAVRNIAKRNGHDLPKNSDIIIEGRKLVESGKFGKTLIMCRNIEQANQVSEIISNLFKVKVEVSHSKNDDDSKELKDFKAGKFEFLCVVKRAREGYDDKKVVNLIDITMTHNIDLIYQMFCRVVRKDIDNENTKLYLKVTSNTEGMPAYTMNIMTAALMLGNTENLSRFNGVNFRGITMPKVQIEDNDEPIVRATLDIVSENGNIIRRRDISELMALDLVQMFSEDHDNLIEGNDRYAMTTLGESLDVLSGDVFCEDKKSYFDLIRKENITGSNIWTERYKEFSHQDGTKYRSNPWRFFNQTNKEFFDECYPDSVDRKETYKNKQGYFKLFKKEKIYSEPKYHKIYEKLSKRDNLNYHSAPWRVFENPMTMSDFFNECFPERKIYDNKQGYFDLIRKENITGRVKYGEKYKELSKRDDLNYHSTPWRQFKISSTKFFNECFNKQLDKKLYFDLIKKENITGVIGWMKKYKKLSKRDSVTYVSEPWTLSNQTGKQFFNECYPHNFFYDNKPGYFELFKKQNVSRSGIWAKKYKELSKKDGVKYHSNPWDLFKQTEAEFFDECYPDRQKTVTEKQIYFSLFRQENITGNSVWTKKYKELSKKNNVEYVYHPCRLFKQTEAEFFKEYKEWLKENPKTEREYRPAFLGEFSEMNKKWNTSNSKTNHKRLNGDSAEWEKYHKLYSSLRPAWGNDIPYKVIAKELNKRPDWIVGDFGCGENLLSKEIKNKVHAFDHIAIDKNVTSCDITHVPLEDNTLDVVVFSLSLMGTNYKEYFKEAYRVLKPMGVIMIAEPSTRWQDKEDKLKDLLAEAGFKMSGEIRFSERFIYLDAIKY